MKKQKNINYTKKLKKVLTIKSLSELIFYLILLVILKCYILNTFILKLFIYIGELLVIIKSNFIIDIFSGEFIDKSKNINLNLQLETKYNLLKPIKNIIKEINDLMSISDITTLSETKFLKEFSLKKEVFTLKESSILKGYFIGSDVNLNFKEKSFDSIGINLFERNLSKINEYLLHNYIYSLNNIDSFRLKEFANSYKYFIEENFFKFKISDLDILDIINIIYNYSNIRQEQGLNYSPSSLLSPQRSSPYFPPLGYREETYENKNYDKYVSLSKFNLLWSPSLKFLENTEYYSIGKISKFSLDPDKLFRLIVDYRTGKVLYLPDDLKFRIFEDLDLGVYCKGENLENIIPLLYERNKYFRITPSSSYILNSGARIYINSPVITLNRYKEDHLLIRKLFIEFEQYRLKKLEEKYINFNKSLLDTYKYNIIKEKTLISTILNKFESIYKNV